MNHTLQRRRPPCTMPARALYLTMKQSAADRRDAARMRHLARLTTIKPAARMLALAGLVKA